MKTIKTTALIVWGDKDFVVPGRNITRLSKELKNSVFIKIKNSGHMIQEEQPEETFSAIDHFIKNTKPQQK